MKKSNFNFIGWNNPNGTNVISSNEQNGILVTKSKDNIIVGNNIGVGKGGLNMVDLSNNMDGINIIDSSNNIIGSRYNLEIDKESNLITENLKNGISVQGLQSNTNEIRGNQIYDNNGLGIRSWRRWSNNKRSSSNGPGRIVNYPEGIIYYNSDQDKTIIHGKVTQNDISEIDIYLNDQIDGSGFGEGKKFLMTANLDDINSNAFNIVFDGDVFNPEFIIYLRRGISEKSYSYSNSCYI